MTDYIFWQNSETIGSFLTHFECCVKIHQLVTVSSKSLTKTVTLIVRRGEIGSSPRLL